jgi:hypothetical protein
VEESSSGVLNAVIELLAFFISKLERNAFTGLKRRDKESIFLKFFCAIFRGKVLKSNSLTLS